MRTLLALLSFIPITVSAQAPESLFNLVTLSAQAEREVPNDLMTTVLAAEAEGADPAQLADGANRAMKRALADAQAVRSVKARSGNYQTFPVYDKNKIARWRVRQELRLESSDFNVLTELVGRLQATLVVISMHSSVADATRRQVEKELIPEAIAAFEERAKIARDTLKMKDYRVRNLLIGASTPAVPYLAQARSAFASSLSATPAVEPGTTRIVITVSGTVQLQ